MNLVNGKEREELEELVKQLRSHGDGGMSSALLKAMYPYCAMNTYQLALALANQLLGLRVTVIGSGGGGALEGVPNDSIRCGAGGGGVNPTFGVATGGNGKNIR